MAVSANSADLSLLLEMGFPQEKAEKALSETGNNGIESAMEWLVNHENDPVKSEDPSVATSGDTSESSEAKSIKCNECNKLFKSSLEVEYHAVKSGHSDFSESTEEKVPLTEEEKKEQLKNLEERMKLKRAEREGKEKAEELEKEKKRIQSGKEIAAMREKMRDMEAKKLVDERRREKAEEEKARARVKAQIEADKEARRLKQGGAAKAPVIPAAPTPVSPPAVAKSYTETKLQIRLPNGQALTNSFGVKEPLSAVRLYIEMNRTDGNSGSFNLMTNFPKKMFAGDDFDSPLDALGLVPSAVLIVTRQV